jgi:hypothetical protein
MKMRDEQNRERGGLSPLTSPYIPVQPGGIHFRSEGAGMPSAPRGGGSRSGLEPIGAQQDAVGGAVGAPGTEGRGLPPSTPPFEWGAGKGQDQETNSVPQRKGGHQESSTTLGPVGPSEFVTIPR